MTQSANNHRPRVAKAADKLTIKSREDRSTLIKNTASSSPIWAANQDVSDAGNAVIQAGKDLADGEKLAQQLEAKAETARKEVVTARITWDERFGVYAGNAELYAVKPEDITGLALPLRDETQYPLVPPLHVFVRYDVAAARLRIHVVPPPGRYRSRIEISPDPIAPGSFQEVKGNGARRALAGYPSGGHWVRAAMVNAQDQSDYSAPVFVKIP